jgi:hypothetical protein
MHNFRGPPNLLYSEYRVSFPEEGSSRRGVNLTNYLHLVLRLKMSGAILLFPHTLSWHEQGQILPFSSIGDENVVGTRISEVERY